jgi:high-affinity iron transporter
MVSQAFGFFVAAGAFADLSRTAWDTSSILSEQGLFGRSLGTLIGYTARPAEIQAIMYALTLGTLVAAMTAIDKNFSFTALFRRDAVAAE